MAIFDLRTFGDLVASIREELQIGSTDETAINRIKRDINIVYAEVVGRRKWFWLSGSVDITVPAYTNAGTASVTQDSGTLTLTDPPAASKAGYFFAVDGFSEIYTIESHVAGSATIKLRTEFTGATNSAVTYKIWTNKLPLPPDCKETSEVWHETFFSSLQNAGRNEFRRLTAKNPRNEGAPAIFHTGDFNDPDQTSAIASLPAVSTRSSSSMRKTIVFASAIPTALAAKLNLGDPVRWRISQGGHPSYNGDVIINAISSTNVANDTVSYTGLMEHTESATADATMSISQLDQTQDYSRYRELYIYPALRNIKTTLHVDYFKHVLPLENDSDEPLIPKEDRIVLRFGALDLTWTRARNDAQAARNRTLFESRVAQMEGKWQSSVDKARLAPSRDYLNSKRRQLRSQGGSNQDFSLSMSGGGPGISQNVTSSTPNTVAVFDNDGALVASPSVTTGELNFLNGATSNIQTQINDINTLTSGCVLIGDLSNQAQEVAVTGDVSLSTSGVTAIATGVIVNSDINTSAAIARSKVASGTAYRILTNNAGGALSENAALTGTKVVVSDSNGQLTSSTVNPTELTFLTNVEALTSVTLNDNQTSPTVVASWALSSFNSISIMYSLKRISSIETGIINLVSDGTSASISQGAVAALGTMGVTLSADVNGGNLRLLYTTTSTGSSPALKYKLNKWLS